MTLEIYEISHAVTKIFYVNKFRGAGTPQAYRRENVFLDRIPFFFISQQLLAKVYMTPPWRGFGLVVLLYMALHWSYSSAI